MLSFNLIVAGFVTAIQNLVRGSRITLLQKFFYLCRRHRLVFKVIALAIKIEPATSRVTLSIRTGAIIKNALHLDCFGTFTA